jgi:hypothetical protein
MQRAPYLASTSAMAVISYTLWFHLTVIEAEPAPHDHHPREESQRHRHSGDHRCCDTHGDQFSLPRRAIRHAIADLPLRRISQVQCGVDADRPHGSDASRQPCLTRSGTFQTQKMLKKASCAGYPTSKRSGLGQGFSYETPMGTVGFTAQGLLEIGSIAEALCAARSDRNSQRTPT